MRIVSVYDSKYTAKLTGNQLWCHKGQSLEQILAVRDKHEAQVIIDHWSLNNCSVRDSQRFYDIQQLFPFIRMDELAYSPDRKSIRHNGDIVSFEL